MQQVLPKGKILGGCDVGAADQCGREQGMSDHSKRPLGAGMQVKHGRDTEVAALGMMQTHPAT